MPPFIWAVISGSAAGPVGVADAVGSCMGVCQKSDWVSRPVRSVVWAKVFLWKCR